MSRRDHAFTLIELLTVISIIAVLAAILFPVFAKAREQARTSTCASNVSQLSRAFVMYVGDNNGRYPSEGGAGRPMVSDWVQVGDRKGDAIVADVKHGSIYPYVKERGVYRCQADITKSEVSYTVSHPFDLIRETAIRWPSTSTFVVEEYVDRWAGHNDGTFWPLRDNSDWTQGSLNWNYLANWHIGKGLVLFADGHVKAVLQDDLTPRTGVAAGGPFPRYFRYFQPDRRDE